MCTVSFIARQQGYLLGMNRDEQLTRPAALPPRPQRSNGVTVVHPAEGSGGTWISLNETGVTLALINWYSVPARVPHDPISRGEVVRRTSAASTPRAVDAELKHLWLARINPFRLIGIFPATREVIEWRWNRQRLERRRHGWKVRQWISSGYDERGAQRIRSRTFRQESAQTDFGRRSWLRRLHTSHAPECGPFSTCMHRADAATVSYSEIEVSASRAALRYCAGPPCGTEASPSLSKLAAKLKTLPLRRRNPVVPARQIRRPLPRKKSTRA